MRHCLFAARLRGRPAILLAAGLLVASAARPEPGKLLPTGGVSSVEVAAVGGLMPWAVTGSYATTGQWGFTAFATGARTRDYRLVVHGVAVGLGERLEASLARQHLDAGNNREALGLPGCSLRCRWPSC